MGLGSAMAEREPVGRGLGNLGGGALSLSFMGGPPAPPCCPQGLAPAEVSAICEKGTSTWLMGWPGHIILDTAADPARWAVFCAPITR